MTPLSSLRAGILYKLLNLLYYFDIEIFFCFPTLQGLKLYTLLIVLFWAHFSPFPGDDDGGMAPAPPPAAHSGSFNLGSQQQPHQLQQPTQSPPRPQPGMVTQDRPPTQNHWPSTQAKSQQLQPPLSVLPPQNLLHHHQCLQQQPLTLNPQHLHQLELLHQQQTWPGTSEPVIARNAPLWQPAETACHQTCPQEIETTAQSYASEPAEDGHDDQKQAMDESDLLIRAIEESGLTVGPSDMVPNDGDAQDPDGLAEIDLRALIDIL